MPYKDPDIFGDNPQGASGIKDTEIFGDTPADSPQRDPFSYSPQEVERMRRQFVSDTGTLTQRAKEYVPSGKTLAKYARPVVEGGLAGLGAIIGSGVEPGGGTVAGGGLGYAIGKNIMDTVEGKYYQNPQEAAIGTLNDIATGAEYEMGGQVAGKLVGGAVSKLSTPIQNAKRYIGDLIERSAGKQIEAATTKAGPVAEQAAKNAAETEALSGLIPGFNVGLGQASEDPGLLALQRRVNMQTDTGKVLNAEQTMRNNQALQSYLNGALPEGQIDDVMAALERGKAATTTEAAQATSAAERTAASLPAATKESAGQTLREGATAVKRNLRQQANDLYDAVPQDMEIDSTPLYQKLQEIGGEFDPAFQRPTANPTNVVGRAKGALEPQPSTILGPDGKPFNTPRMEQDIPEKMTFGQLKDFRSQVTTAERQARNAGDYELAYKYSQLREGVDQTLQLATDTGQGAGVDALRKANQFYREQYVPTIRQGATGRVLANDKTGAAKVQDALVGGEYFKPGQKGIAAADSFNSTFGATPEARQAVKDYAANDLLTYARNPVTGEINSGKVATWLNNHKEALGRLNLGDDFAGVQQATKLADTARANEAAFAKSRFGRVIDQADPDKTMEYLFSGENSRNTGKTMKQLLTLTQGDEQATNGLKRSFADMLLRKMQNSAQDMTGEQVLSIAKGQQVMRQFDPAMRQLYSAEEMQALKDVQRAIEIQGRINKAPSGVAGSQTADLLGTPGQMVRNYLPLDPKWRMMRVVFGKLKSGFDAEVNNYLARAMYDPTLAAQLRNTARVGKARGADAAAQKLQQDIGIALSSGVIAGRPQPTGYTWQDGELTPNAD